jgi:hypothetical protein
MLASPYEREVHVREYEENHAPEDRMQLVEITVMGY